MSKNKPVINYRPYKKEKFFFGLFTSTLYLNVFGHEFRWTGKGKKLKLLPYGKVTTNRYYSYSTNFPLYVEALRADGWSFETEFHYPYRCSSSTTSKSKDPGTPLVNRVAVLGTLGLFCDPFSDENDE